MSWLAELFPLVAFLAMSGMAVYALAIRSRLARGSQSAGPMVPIVQDIHGLKAQAWDITSIAANLQGNPEHTLTVVRGYCQSVALDSSQTLGSPNQQVEVLVGRLEHHLELKPLTVTQEVPIRNTDL